MRITAITSAIARALGTSAAIGVVAVVSAALFTAVVAAWTAPSANPPSGNMSPPITAGSVTQTKAGNLTVNGMTIFGNTLIQASGPSNGYLSFGTTAGTSSYGMRSRNGLIEFKNQGGHWFSLASTTANYVSSGQWSAGPSNSVYYTGGNVGINTSAPNAPLEVNGYVKVAGQSAEPQACTAARKGMMAVTGSTASLCICNGTAWVTESNGGTCAWNVVPGSQDFSSSGTFNVPAYNTLTVQVWGAGGGGGGWRYGAYSYAGNPGGASSFNSDIIANGGGGGFSAGGAGGTASGGTTNTVGGTGIVGTMGNCNSGVGGASPNGGAGGATAGASGGAPGGGGASGCYINFMLSGGGGGGYSSKTYTAGQLSGTVTVVVGAGGVGGGEAGAAGWPSLGGTGGNGRVYISWN